MRFLYQKFQAKKKQIVEVTIDATTKVKFMTAYDLKKYKMGKTHNYFGGIYEDGVVRFVIPHDAVWNVVVEKGTLSTPIEVTAKCSLLPPDREALSTIPLDAAVTGTLNAYAKQADNGIEKSEEELEELTDDDEETN